MTLKDPLTQREIDMLDQTTPSLSGNPPGVDLPKVLFDFRDDIQREIEFGDNAAIVSAKGTFSTNSGGFTLVTGAGSDDDMAVTPQTDGDYYVIVTAVCTVSSNGEQVVAALFRDDAAFKDTERRITVVAAGDEHAITLTALVTVVAGEQISMKVKRKGGPTYNVQIKERSMIVARKRTVGVL